jgi:hypothetical protein
VPSELSRQDVGEAVAGIVRQTPRRVVETGRPVEGHPAHLPDTTGRVTPGSLR